MVLVKAHRDAQFSPMTVAGRTRADRLRAAGVLSGLNKLQDIMEAETLAGGRSLLERIFRTDRRNADAQNIVLAVRLMAASEMRNGQYEIATTL